MDTKLKFKPIELIDIGIDKHTKIPMPILADNIIFTNDVVNGVPINSFTIKVSTLSFNMKINNIRNISLSINYGDGTLKTLTGTTITDSHTYLTNTEKTIEISGDLDKITGFTCTDSGIVEIHILKLFKLNHLYLSGNSIEEIDIKGIVSLNTIDIKNNYLNASSIDDIIINANTFLTYNGLIELTGTNNSKPSVYSELAIDNLTNNKLWTLNYNI